jgi:hypothetical protein
MAGCGVSMTTRTLQQAIDIMRIAIGRRNENDPDSSDSMLLSYINDFYSLVMPNDTKLIENFGTLTFTIDESNTTGVYTFNDVGASHDFINLSQEAFISLLDPEDNSVSWNQLPIYQDPGEFYMIWGINNDEILIPGYPTMMLFYGNEMVFRTIPNTSYQVRIYGYKKNADFETPDDQSPDDQNLPFDYWLRYIAYGAAVNYVRDFRYAPEARTMIETTFKSERKQMLTRTHNQIKMSRSMPRF